ncbi:LOW QUALITY PROTEIN: hypothetical protein TorRG33x02_207400 [Trema orientale]|uniref:Uncharacterized protein n=1 Tax=Trema orientale TaxID=63057 RepID=A0A2P5ED58_TREOI|nr:LOW QUALITY PROTEIN: hypothetical protein TorRG33x02_207400 [Trema orientale]
MTTTTQTHKYKCDDAESKLHFENSFVSNFGTTTSEIQRKKKSNQIQIQLFTYKDIGLSKQISNPSRLSKNLSPTQRPEATPARHVEQAELGLGSAAEDRERRQRQARRDLRVYGVRESDAAVVPVPAGAGGGRTGGLLITHRLVNR